MHGMFLFLINIYEPTTLKTQVVCDFESYLDEKGDENNWSQPLYVVTQKNKVISLCEKDDYRNRDEAVKHVNRKTAWVDTLNLAKGIANWDIAFWAGKAHMFDNAKTPEVDIDQVIKDIASEVANGNKEKEYALKQLITYRGTLEACTYPFFAPRRYSPYTWRCIDLRDEPSKELQSETVLLAVDIHT
jgi:hypothetical protein